MKVSTKQLPDPELQNKTRLDTTNKRASPSSGGGLREAVAAVQVFFLFLHVMARYHFVTTITTLFFNKEYLVLELKDDRH